MLKWQAIPRQFLSVLGGEWQHSGEELRALGFPMDGFVTQTTLACLLEFIILIFHCIYFGVISFIGQYSQLG